MLSAKAPCRAVAPARARRAAVRAFVQPQQQQHNGAPRTAPKPAREPRARRATATGSTRGHTPHTATRLQQAAAAGAAAAAASRRPPVTAGARRDRETPAPRPVADSPLHNPTPSLPPVTNGVIFRQLFDGTSSTYTYLLADPASRAAMLIDPVLEQV